MYTHAQTQTHTHQADNQESTLQRRSVVKKGMAMAQASRRAAAKMRAEGYPSSGMCILCRGTLSTKALVYVYCTHTHTHTHT